MVQWLLIGGLIVASEVVSHEGYVVLSYGLDGAPTRSTWVSAYPTAGPPGWDLPAK